jgi:hypothetical protein
MSNKNQDTVSLYAKSDDPRQMLLALLPSHSDVQKITNATRAWVLASERPPGFALKPLDPILGQDYAALQELDNLGLAMALLYLALFIQQLPPEFDLTQLEMEASERISDVLAETINSTVLAKEEMVCCLRGVECLHLLAMIYINSGVIRKAWMAFRRCVDICRMLGFSESFSDANRDSMDAEAVALRRIWLGSAAGDAHCSLLLGLPPGTDLDIHLADASWEDPAADTISRFQRRLCLASIRLSQRNIYGTPCDRQATASIDQELDGIFSSVPATWWQPVPPRKDKSNEAAVQLGRVMAQLWFFQLRLQTHLPFAFSNAVDASRSKCLEAARTILQRYATLWQAGNSQLDCRVLDLTAFMAGVTLLLAWAQDLREQSGDRGKEHMFTSDYTLVSHVTESFAALGLRSPREHIARQSAEVLKALLGVCASELSLQDISVTRLGEEKSAVRGIGGFPSTRSPLGGPQKTALQDLLGSFVQKSIGLDTPASKLIDLTFWTAQKSAGGAPSRDSGAPELQVLDDFLNSIVDWDES